MFKPIGPTPESSAVRTERQRFPVVSVPAASQFGLEPQSVTDQRRHAELSAEIERLTKWVERPRPIAGVSVCGWMTFAPK